MRHQLDTEFDYVAIVDFLPPSDRKSERTSEKLGNLLNRNHILWHRLTCHSKKSLISALLWLATESKSGRIFAIHFVGHGDPKGLVMPDDSNVNEQINTHPFPSDSSVVDLSGLGSTPTLFTHEEQDSLANQIFHKKITVPEIHSVGWVKSFTKGQNTYDSVSVALNQLKGTKPKDAEQDIQLRQKLERIQQVSLHLAQTEHAINALDEKNINQVHEFQVLQKEIAEDRDNFYEHFFSFAAGTMLDTRSSLKNHREIAELGEFVSEVKKNVDYFEDLKASIQSGSAPIASLEAGVAYVKRFSEDLQKISGRLNARTAGRYFKQVTEAKELEDIFWMEAEFAKLNFVTEVKVEDLQNSNDATRTTLKDKLLPLQRQYSDELDSLCNDSQIKDFVGEKNQKK